MPFSELLLSRIGGTQDSGPEETEFNAKGHRKAIRPNDVFIVSQMGSVAILGLIQGRALLGGEPWKMPLPVYVEKQEPWKIQLFVYFVQAYQALPIPYTNDSFGV